ncbi:MAG: hypothetical protein CMF62_11590 [Magnetococcales bacterium]|nr:hypothetical protein [Magnetococcales bacterium]|tara:strand:+ start:298886 stop:299470 length:585 start_codon:yes stop_codon:yes gene_type:complete
MSNKKAPKWGKQARLVRGSLRYKLMQGISKILWGRELGYLSWWYHASRAAGVIFHHNGKVLMGRRRGTLDASGKLSLIGGFVDDQETSAEAVSREIWEETRLEIPASVFTNSPLFKHTEGFGDIAEMTEMAQVVVWYTYELSDEQVAALQLTEEVSEFVWIDPQNIETLNDAGEMAFSHHYNHTKEFFRRGPAK